LSANATAIVAKAANRIFAGGTPLSYLDLPAAAATDSSASPLAADQAAFAQSVQTFTGTAASGGNLFSRLLEGAGGDADVRVVLPTGFSPIGNDTTAALAVAARTLDNYRSRLNNLWDIAVDPRRQRIAASDHSGDVRLWDPNDGTELEIHNPADLPDLSHVTGILEPLVKIEIICPNENIGDLMKLCDARRGMFKSQRFLSDTRQILDYELPLAEIIYDFYDKLKSITRGYGTMDYELIGFRQDDLVKVNILVNNEPVEALSLITHRALAEHRSRVILEKLKKQIDRHQFEIPLQAAIGGRIIARESIKALRKNVLAKCYGGDVSRKRKLLEKQKEGKKRMKTVGMVSIPQEAFMAILDQGD
jgi:hypothetical protein